MPHNAGESRSDNSAANGLRLQSPFAVLSALVVSLILHATMVFVLMIWGIRGCGDGSMGVTEGESRLVGIYVKQPKNEDDRTDNNSESNETELQIKKTPDLLSTSPNLKVSDEPPVKIELPNAVTKRVGPGGAAPSFSTGNIDDIVRPNSRPAAAHPLSGLGPGEVSFFNARDTGAKIVFVIDTSSSMYGKPIRVALSELSASVQSLQPNQQFQVVFYDLTARTLNIRASKEGGLYRAGNYVKILALQEIAGVSVRGGTDHRAALIKALNMKPEIVFLLTDAETILQPRQMNEILRLNKNGVRIHCIEFGEGPDLSADNSFLKRLARQSNGTYRYRDVKKF